MYNGSNLVGTFNVTSGRAGAMMNDSNWQHATGGPLPTGSYLMFRDEGRFGAMNAIGRLIDNPRADWGSFRIPLHPVGALPVSRDDGKRFQMHGGMFQGSAGCIDCGGGLFGNGVTAAIEYMIKADSDGIMLLECEE